MLKSCGKCGKVHGYNYRCNAGRIARTKTPDQRLRSTNRWTNKAIEIKERSKWLCAVCLTEGRYNYDDLEVHHIEKLKDAPEKLLDDDNLICLCKHHHELADAGKIDAGLLKELVETREKTG